MAAYYSRTRNKKQGQARLVTSDAQPKVDATARFKPSWCQLRSAMTLCDDMYAFWKESGGEPWTEENLEGDFNAAAPMESVLEIRISPLPVNRIDEQLIALNRNLAPVVQAPTRKPVTNLCQLPMLRLEQISYGQRYRLAGSLA